MATAPAEPAPPEGPEEDAASWVNAFSEGTLSTRMGITFLEATPQRLVATMPAEGNTQPYGVMHGGASVVLAESLGSIGAALYAGRDRIALGVDINATHHRAVRRGVVTGVAVPVFLGRSAATYEVVISNEDGARVCTARITCALQSRRRR